MTDFVFGKTRTRNAERLVAIPCGGRVFKEVDLENLDCYEFGGYGALDDDDWAYIEDFSKKPYFLKLLLDQNALVDLPNIHEEQFSSLKWLASRQNNGIYFQRVVPSLYDRHGALHLADPNNLQLTHNRLTIREEPDAIYLPEGDRLYFRMLSSISAIFDGIEPHHLEASAEVASELLNSRLLQVSHGFNFEGISTASRHRMLYVRDFLKNIRVTDRPTVVRYLLEYDQKLVANKTGSRIIIRSESDLQSVIDGIEEAIYRGHDSYEERTKLEMHRIFSEKRY